MKYMDTSQHVPLDPEESQEIKEEIQEFIEEMALAGKNLRTLREEHGLTVDKLSDLVHLESDLLIKMEQGKQPIPEETAHALAKIFNVDYKKFL